MKALRQQVTTLQEQHTREMAELKDMLKRQAASVAASPQPQGTSVAPVVPPSLYESLKQSAAVLVPQAQSVKGADLDLSAVLDLYFYHDDTKEGMSHLRQELSGFGHHHAADGHDHGGSENGFNLRHVELGFSAEVDPYFRAWTTVAVEDDGADLRNRLRLQVR